MELLSSDEVTSQERKLIKSLLDVIELAKSENITSSQIINTELIKSVLVLIDTLQELAREMKDNKDKEKSNSKSVETIPALLLELSKNWKIYIGIGMILAFIGVMNYINPNFIIQFKGVFGA
jgi:hypothetical protein